MNFDPALQVECAILGAWLLDEPRAATECRAFNILPADFADERHQLIYAACIELHERGVAVDYTTLCDTLRRDDALERAGGPEYLGQLIDAVPTGANVGYHARLLRGAARERQGGQSEKSEHAQERQVGQAVQRVELPASAFIHLPWPKLDAVVGGIAPGTVTFLAGHTGSGKTSFLLTLTLKLLAQGARIYYAGLESHPKILRSQLACRVLGHDPGWILTGEYLKDVNAAAIRAQLVEEIHRQDTSEAYRRIRFAPQESVDLKAMANILVEAKDFGADLVIVDHIDALTSGTSAKEFTESRASVSLAKSLGAEKLQHRLFIATQTNWTGLSHDPLRNHRPIRSDMIYMGGHKEQYADLFLGTYRPLNPGATKDQLAAVRDGNADISTILAPNTTAINVIKHRLRGERRGDIITLGYWRGEIINEPMRTLPRATDSYRDAA